MREIGYWNEMTFSKKEYYLPGSKAYISLKDLATEMIKHVREHRARATEPDKDENGKNV